MCLLVYRKNVVKAREIFVYITELNLTFIITAGKRYNSLNPYSYNQLFMPIQLQFSEDFFIPALSKECLGKMQISM